MCDTDLVLDPIERLSFEHRQIDRVLVAICEVTIRVASGASPKHAFFASTVDFIERFADGCHHAKEEGALFEEAWAQGFSRSGPLACMTSQHELGRDLTRSMKKWVNGDGHFRTANQNELLLAAAKYMNLLWNHIATEDCVIFPALKSFLSRESLLRVLSRYQQVDALHPEEFRIAADSVVALAGITLLEQTEASRACAR